jgi:23S rRNA pseudouridine2605 synthase
MEDNKKGTRKRIVRKASEGHAEKVDYSTSRSFDSEERPARRVYAGGQHRQENGRRQEGGFRQESGHRQENGHRQEGGFRSEKPYGGGTRKPYGAKPESRSGYGKPSFGNKRPGGKPSPKRSQADEGMSAMLRRKPQVVGRYSDDDTAKTEIQEVVRLNKFIANSGVCSRREADTLIQSGVVTVNGEVITELGTKINVLTDDVRFNGQRLKGEEKVYIVMNKPKGYVTTASDPHAEKTVMDLLKGCPTRVFPVGRLDKNTTGVLMFTNDGEMAERLTHPSYNKKKIYQVVLDAPLSEEDKQKILDGIELTDGIVAADELEFIDAHDHRQLGIEIHSGKNRIVRRIFESLGYEVRALDRVYFAGLTKKGLKKSDWRYLTEGEVNILKMGAYV